MIKIKKSAPIGAWKSNFKEINQIDRLIDLQTDMRGHKEVTLPIK